MQNVAKFKNRMRKITQKMENDRIENENKKLEKKLHQIKPADYINAKLLRQQYNDHNAQISYIMAQKEKERRDPLEIKKTMDKQRELLLASITVK